MGDREVHADPSQPRARRSGRRVPESRTVGANEGLLRQVLSRRRIEHNTSDRTVDGVELLVVELPELGLGIELDGLGHPLSVRARTALANKVRG